MVVYNQNILSNFIDLKSNSSLKEKVKILCITNLI